MTHLKIPTNIFQQMVTQAKAQVPVESCGILAGRDNRIEKLYEMTNADNSSDHFTLEPEEQFAVVKDIRSVGLKMLAIYHSHPFTPPRLSQEDIRLSLTPDVAYVILSLQDFHHPAVKGFSMENGNITEVRVEVLQEQK